MFTDYEQKHYNVLLLVTKKNMNLLNRSVDYIKENLHGKRIIAIASKELENELNGIGVEFLDENAVYDLLTYSSVREFIRAKNLDVTRTGWYYQQFLKLAYSYICEDDYYLVWDSDTIPLHDIAFFSNSKPHFICKKEYHLPYFHTINRLFDGNVQRHDKGISFVAENMLFNKETVKEMLSTIMMNKHIDGGSFFEKIINSIDVNEFSASFSEFETYGNYVMRYYPNIYELKRVRSLRSGSFILGPNPTDEQLLWAKKVYDIISIETPLRFSFSWLTRYRFIHFVPINVFAKSVLPLKYCVSFIKGYKVIFYD